MSTTKHQNNDISGTQSHANNPFVASYDIIDFVTTVAFVLTSIANSTSLIFPMVSNVLHLINYGLLGYIQARDLTILQEEELEQIKRMEGNIHSNEQLQEVRNELLPPHKGNKSNAEFSWDYTTYILKLMVCAFLITLSVISTAAVTGAIATFVNGALFPIGYVITTAINLLRFGKNFVKGIYEYFAKDATGESTYKKNKSIVKAFESKYAKYSTQPHQIPESELRKYLEARNSVNQTGRDNIENGVFFGLNASFFAASMLFLLGSSVLFTAVVPPLGMTIAGGIFVGAGLLFAVHALSVLRNTIRAKRGLPERKTFFGWLSDKLYPTVNEQSLAKKGLNFVKLSEPEEHVNIAHAGNVVQTCPQPTMNNPQIKFEAPSSSLLSSYGTTGFFKHAKNIINEMPEKQRVLNEQERLEKIRSENDSIFNESHITLSTLQ